MITENLTIQIQIKKTEAQLPHPLFLKVTDWKQIPQFLMEITSSLKKGISYFPPWDMVLPKTSICISIIWYIVLFLTIEPEQNEEEEKRKEKKTSYKCREYSIKEESSANRKLAKIYFPLYLLLKKVGHRT